MPEQATTGAKGLSERSNARLTRAIADTNCSKCGRSAIKGRSIVRDSGEPRVLCARCTDDREADDRMATLRRKLAEVSRG